MSRPFRKGVNAIIIDSGDNFLIVQKNGYKNNEWNFLGGGREEGETLEENLYREIEEEIGAKKEDLELIGVSSFNIEYDYPEDTVDKIHNGKYRGQSYEQVILKFLGNKDDLVFSTDEFKTHKWISGIDLQTHLIFPNQYSNHKKAIEELLPNLNV